MRIDYPYLRAWCRMMNSAPYYLTDQLEQARKDRAPADAIYTDKNGRWHCFSDVISSLTRFTIENIIDREGWR